MSLHAVVEFRAVTKRFGDVTVIRDVTFVCRGQAEVRRVRDDSGTFGLREIDGAAFDCRTAAASSSYRWQCPGHGASRSAAQGRIAAWFFRTTRRSTIEPSKTTWRSASSVAACRRRARSVRAGGSAKVGLDVKRDSLTSTRTSCPADMRQRVAIARTLILGPRIILMDEPFGALDPATRLRMQELLVSLWREAEATVFFVTHSIEEAVYLGDRVYVFSSSPGTILREI